MHTQALVFVSCRMPGSEHPIRLPGVIPSRLTAVYPTLKTAGAIAEGAFTEAATTWEAATSRKAAPETAEAATKEATPAPELAEAAGAVDLLLVGQEHVGVVDVEQHALGRIVALSSALSRQLATA